MMEAWIRGGFQWVRVTGCKHGKNQDLPGIQVKVLEKHTSSYLVQTPAGATRTVLIQSTTPTPPPVCDICDEDYTAWHGSAHSKVKVVVPNTQAEVERRYKKEVCEHEFCHTCVSGWIEAHVSTGNSQILCPAPDCNCMM